MGQGSRSTFGKYTLLRKLASGGMGEVFLAKQRGPSGFEKLLVIKRILSHHLDKRDYLDMFFSEAKLVARLNHNNIIQIQEMGEIDGDYYIAMEYVRGKSLRDIIDELRAEGRMLPLPHAVDLAIKLCEGLGYAHQARDIRGRPMNIVHRDINPHNVLISYNGDLKLIDFGIAKSEMTSVHTATGTIKGKFVYMSPEQSAADPIDRRSDIFSLGIVLYEMTVLENPFVRQNVVLSLEAIQRHAIPPPSSKRPDAGPMDEILSRALEKRPEERYQTAVEMRDDLRNLFRSAVVTPAEEDISIFLHDLFAADIAEEDRLLAEADRATSTIAAHPEMLAGAATEPPKPSIPNAILDPAAAGLDPSHSSDAEGANPVEARSFADEEPTLAGNLEGIAQRSREVSGGRPSQGTSSKPWPDGAPSGSSPWRDSGHGNGLGGPPIPGHVPEPEGQMMTLIPPDEVVPGTQEEFLPELPTRSDRVPGGGRGNSGRPSPPGSNPAYPSGPQVPLAAVPPVPSSLVSGEGMPRFSALSSTGLGDLVPPQRGNAGAEDSFPFPTLGERDALAETGAAPELPPFAPAHREGPMNGAALDATREMPEEPSNAYAVGPPPSSPPELAISGLRRSSITEGESAAYASSSPPWRRLGLWVAGVLVFGATAVAGFVATRAVTRSTGIARAPQIASIGRPQQLPAESLTASSTVSVAAKTQPTPEPERAPDPKLLAREHSAQPGVVPEPAKARHDGEEQRKRAALKEERKRKLDEERAAKADRKRKAEEDRKQKLEEEREHALKAREEKKRKAEERKRRQEEARAEASTKAEAKAEAAKQARAEAAAKAEAMKQARAESAAKAEAMKQARAQRADAAPSKRHVIAPGAEGSATPKEAPPPPRPKEEPAASEGNTPPIRAARSDKPAPDGVARAGTLTLSTSIELSVEVDGKPTGTSPAVIPVRKSAGKIKLFGQNLDYSVTINYKVEEGGISVRLDANPWAIAKHNGLSLGKTPQNVKAEAKHRFSLNRPGETAPLVVSLLWNAKND